MSFSIDQAKSFFFDRQKVLDKLDAKTRRGLSRIGAFVRRRAKSSLRYAKQTAAPGKPPYVHKGGFLKKRTSKGVTTTAAASFLRELVFFAYDPQTKSVVIGPTLGGPQTGAPHALEHGGQSRRKVGGKFRATRVRPHPFMRPALEAEAPTMAQTLKAAIR